MKRKHSENKKFSNKKIKKRSYNFGITMKTPYKINESVHQLLCHAEISRLLQDRDGKNR